MPVQGSTVLESGLQTSLLLDRYLHDAVRTLEEPRAQEVGAVHVHEVLLETVVIEQTQATSKPERNPEVGVQRLEAKYHVVLKDEM